MFARRGFSQTTTRDIAQASRIAAGTVFNYFPNKESIAMAVIAQAVEGAAEEFAEHRGRAASLDEELFLHVITELHRLEPFRALLGEVVDTALSPFATARAFEVADRFRAEHLERVADIVARRGRPPPSAVAMHLYWTLYVGVLAFWAQDESPSRDDTLVLLDQSMRLFVSSLDESGRAAEETDAG